MVGWKKCISPCQPNHRGAVGSVSIALLTYGGLKEVLPKIERLMDKSFLLPSWHVAVQKPLDPAKSISLGRTGFCCTPVMSRAKGELILVPLCESQMFLLLSRHLLDWRWAKCSQPHFPLILLLSVDNEKTRSLLKHLYTKNPFRKCFILCHHIGFTNLKRLFS